MELEFLLGSTRTLLKDTRIYHVMKNSAQESSWELGGMMTLNKAGIDVWSHKWPIMKGHQLCQRPNS